MKKELIRATKQRDLKKNELIYEQDAEDTFVCFLNEGITIAYEIFPNGATICLGVVDRPGDVVVGGGLARQIHTARSMLK